MQSYVSCVSNHHSRKEVKRPRFVVHNDNALLEKPHFLVLFNSGRSIKSDEATTKPSRPLSEMCSFDLEWTVINTDFSPCTKPGEIFESWPCCAIDLLSRLGGAVQGYLVHEKTQPPLGPP